MAALALDINKPGIDWEERKAIIFKLDAERIDVLFRPYSPLTGENAPGVRFLFSLEELWDSRTIYLPQEMLCEHFILDLMACGSIRAYINKHLPDTEDYERTSDLLMKRFIRMRCKYDFYFFAYAYARIKNKSGGADIPFYLRPAQRKLVKVFEEMRLADEPIRVILLKCRQWGGSTCTDIYMAWIQIFWKTNWNSNIVGHQSSSAANVFDMYNKLMDNIPMWLFYDLGEEHKDTDKVLKANGTIQNIKYLIPRDCKIQTGSARNPESCRSGDAALAHITEEAFFPDTEIWTPSDVLKAASSSVQLLPYTFIVRESTPNGRENAYHDAWVRSNTFDKDGNRQSAYRPVFVAWFEIEDYILKFKTEDEKADFAIWLWEHRNDTQGNGKYYWHLFEIGASLEGIHWYVNKAKEYDSLDDMKQEYPSDDVEAFLYSGHAVFDPYKLKAMEEDCNEPPVFVGDIEGESKDTTRKECVQGIHLVDQKGGPLKIWDMPDYSETVRHRYLVSVDIGGSHKTSDYWCIVVWDRYDVMYGGVPAIVAEWHGHGDPDQMARRCAQIAIYYQNALLVVENNTAYSRMNNTDGDISELFFPILIPLYDNVYCSNASKTLKHPTREKKWGFNTNRSTKVAIVMNYAAVVRAHAYLEREPEALSELAYFMKNDKDGTYGAIPGKHDDRVMARGIGLIVEKEMPVPVVVQIKTKEQKKAEARKKRKPMTTVLGGL